MEIQKEEEERKKREERQKAASISYLKEYKEHTTTLDNYEAQIKEKVESNAPLMMYVYGERIRIKRIVEQLEYNDRTVMQSVSDYQSKV